MKKLVIFDLDGTLIMGKEISKQSYRVVGEEFGLPPLKEAMIESFMGCTFSQVKELLGYKQDDPEGTAFVARIDELESEIAFQINAVYDGAYEALRMLKDQGYELAFCSMGSASYVQSVTKAYGFDHLVTYFRWETPNMTKTQMVKSILQESGADQAVMVGDRLFDIVAGMENNLSCVVCTYGYCDEGVEKLGLCVNSAREIPSAVEALMK